MDFCKQYNERTASQAGMIIPVEITVYEDRTFTFITKTPPASFLIKQALKIESGSKEPNRNKVGKLTNKQLEEIAQDKMPDINANDIEAAKKIIAGTARSMGVEVKRNGAEARKAVQEPRRELRQEALFSTDEAIALVKKNANAKFNETIEIHIRLGVDPKKSDQNVRGTVLLPHGTGRSVRVIAFAKGDNAKAAREAGADFVGEKDLIEKVKAGFTEFDVAVATPDMMAQVGKELGRILAQKMPNPKSGTVSPNIAGAIRDIKAGKVEYRLDKSGDHSHDRRQGEVRREALLENIDTLIDAIVRAKPSASKGTYLERHAHEHDGPGRKNRPEPGEGYGVSAPSEPSPGCPVRGIPFLFTSKKLQV